VRSQTDVIGFVSFDTGFAEELVFTRQFFKYIFAPGTPVLKERLQAPENDWCGIEKCTTFWFLFNSKVRKNIFLQLLETFLFSLNYSSLSSEVFKMSF